ncbi:tRNA 2-selenouridine(34) synthase MnmH [Marinilabiliaceae bacterium JC017]|nr:tRNA 2-selenouridine(34) synthase MnmH [Marinilabiliaceae bacterium JC017]
MRNSFIKENSIWPVSGNHYKTNDIHMKKLTPEEFLKEAIHIPVIDVRSPAEFEEGHIPGAINIALFNNDERAVVGTLYKKTGKEAAVLKGLEIVGPKMADFAKQAKEAAVQGKLLVHCWRGGMRSESMAWLFEKVGIQCALLEGGYKAYRNYLLEQMVITDNLVVIEGHTGGGKTEILKHLATMNEQVIDLEGLACHRGSAFGGIGQGTQPSTQQFQNNMLQQLLTFRRDRPIWVEGESKSIGRVFLPDPFWLSMNTATVLEIVVPAGDRIQRLVEDYASLDAECMEQSILKLKKRLGQTRMQEVLDFFRNKDYAKVAELLLVYYDKTYQYSTDKYKGTHELMQLPSGDARENAGILLDKLKSLELHANACV